MASLKGLKLQGGTYYVRVDLPADVRSHFGKGSIWRTTETGDPREAGRIGAALRVQIKREIADVRAKMRGPVLPPRRDAEAIIALEAWATHQTRMKPSHEGDLSPSPFTIATADLFQRAVDDPQTASEIPGLDPYIARCLTAHGCAVEADDPVIPAIRENALIAFLYAIKYGEKVRQADAFMRKARESLSDGVVTDFPVVPNPVERQTPAPALTISKLYERWLTSINPPEKERQRLDHQFRRLKEVVGDKPANYVTKADVSEFMALAARFPGRKRSAALNALPMGECVEEFEKANAKAQAKGEEVIPTLTKAALEVWFASFKRCWQYAVLMELLDRNPWEGLKPIVVNGAKSVKRRAFDDKEIKYIFEQPHFQAPQRRDAKWWLPILSLFHGGRLAEFAAMPLADVKQTDAGTWYFDLTGRAVKTETSQREIPLHPDMLALGFADYIASLRKAGETWLFPDLDHVSRHGPGHAFSKWWGAYMDKIKLTDPALTHHSWRHTWKRYARASDVKEEIHDLITGHKGVNAVSRRYGEGAPIEALAREMARIEFAAFPAMEPYRSV